MFRNFLYLFRHILHWKNSNRVLTDVFGKSVCFRWFLFPTTSRKLKFSVFADIYTSKKTGVSKVSIITWNYNLTNEKRFRHEESILLRTIAGTTFEILFKSKFISEDTNSYDFFSFFALYSFLAKRLTSFAGTHDASELEYPSHTTR